MAIKCSNRFYKSVYKIIYYFLIFTRLINKHIHESKKNQNPLKYHFTIYNLLICFLFHLLFSSVSPFLVWVLSFKQLINRTNSIHIYYKRFIVQVKKERPEIFHKGNCYNSCLRTLYGVLVNSKLRKIFDKFLFDK